MGVGDFIWAKYIVTVSSGNAFIGATWGAVVVFIGAFVTISYIDDKRMIVPACIGAWIGTYLSI